MGEKNIQTLTTNTIFILLALFAMLTSFILIVNNEGRGEIFDDYPEIEEFHLSITNQTGSSVVEIANTNANLSAAYNPELAISAADQSGNAMALNQQTLATNSWDKISIFIGLIFGNVWTASLSGIIIALLTFLFTYRFIRWIRSGS